MLNPAPLRFDNLATTLPKPSVFCDAMIKDVLDLSTRILDCATLLGDVANALGAPAVESNPIVDAPHPKTLVEAMGALRANVETLNTITGRFK